LEKASRESRGIGTRIVLDDRLKDLTRLILLVCLPEGLTAPVHGCRRRRRLRVRGHNQSIYRIGRSRVPVALVALANVELRRGSVFELRVGGEQLLETGPRHRTGPRLELCP